MPLLRNTSDRWGLVAQAFHWITGGFVLVLIGQGWWMKEMVPRAERFGQYQWHASVGYALLALMVVRVAWRAVNRVPDAPSQSKGWEKRAAAIGHWVLYVLTLGAAVFGWALAGTFRRPLDMTLWDTVKVPALVASQDRGLHELFEGLHEFFSWTLAGLVIAHVAVALYHHCRRHDGVMTRMLPWGRGSDGDSAPV